jgi:hypothetical protein
MRPTTPLEAPVLSAACCRVLAAATVLVTAACGDGDEITEPPPNSISGRVPQEVLRAAQEAGGGDGHVVYLKGVDPKTGAVVRGQAQFLPSAVALETGRPTSLSDAAASVQAQPADHPNPYVTVAPSGLRLPRTYRLPQRDSATTNSFNTFCCYNGQCPQNTDFNIDSLKILSVANTGGHEDAGHTGQKPKGRLTRTSGPSDALGEWPFTYYADSTAGDDQLRFYYTVFDTDQPAFCRGPNVSAPYFFAKRWPGLIRIEALAGLEYGSITSAHFDIFYATPFTASLLPWVAELYRENYPSGIVRLTAGTLIYGGLHDFRNTWRRPHNRHRVGTDVDLNAAPGGGGAERLEAIRRTCVRSGFVHAVVEPPDHVHCYHFVGYTR